jgi:predicted nucleic acid-binding protein
MSSLTPLEVRSAIRRREKSGDLTRAHAAQAIAALIRETTATETHLVTKAIQELAAEIVDRQTLRALDAIQLATALSAGQSSGNNELQFIASDDKLLPAAAAEGLDVWNPCD